MDIASRITGGEVVDVSDGYSGKEILIQNNGTMYKVSAVSQTPPGTDVMSELDTTAELRINKL